METFRSCKTHKDRSILLMAMLDFWDTGIVPEIPKHLSDKWRFIHHALALSRVKSYEKLREIAEKTGQKKSTSSSYVVPKSSESHIDNQQDTPNHCPVTSQPLSTYRIENKRIKNKENDNDNIECIDSKCTMDNNPGFSSSSCPSCSPYLNIDIDAEWKEVCDTINRERGGFIENDGSEDIVPAVKPIQPSITSSLSSTNASKETPVSTHPDDTQHTFPHGTETPNTRFVQAEIETSAARVLEGIKSKYRQYATPVRFTYVDAESVLGLNKELFYKAIKYLVSNGSITCTKTTAPDGKTVNRFTPTSMDIDGPVSDQVILVHPTRAITWPSFAYYNICSFFENTPFYYQKDWDYETFAQHNVAQIQLAEEQMPGLSNRPGAYCQELWGIIKFFEKNNFEIRPYHE